jgi:hypothetical protein
MPNMATRRRLCRQISSQAFLSWCRHEFARNRSGKPIEEPVAWYGPIVMNTEAELEQAYAELRNGTFIKQGPTISI